LSPSTTPTSAPSSYTSSPSISPTYNPIQKAYKTIYNVGLLTGPNLNDNTDNNCKLKLSIQGNTLTYLNVSI